MSRSERKTKKDPHFVLPLHISSFFSPFFQPLPPYSPPLLSKGRDIK